MENILFHKKSVLPMSELLDSLKNSNNIGIEDIENLIANNEKESLFLEYKSGEWLQNNKSGIFDLCKWVSSFANSDGGTLIIGVSEKEESNGERYPDNINGINPINFNEDIGKWIEDVVVSRIYPKLNPIPRIIPIKIRDSHDFIVVIQIEPTNNLIHSTIKNGKHLYFHRHNFQVLQMDEWEIRTLVYGRTPPPILITEIKKITIHSHSSERINGYMIKIRIENAGWHIVKYLQIGIIGPNGDFVTQLKPDLTVKFRENKKDYLLDSLKLFFEIEDQNNINVETITLLEPDFLHPYDSIELSYRFNNQQRGLPGIEEINFGLYLLAENMVRPDVYGLKVANLGSGSPSCNIFKYENQKLEIRLI